MNLLLAAVWLERDRVEFSELREFSKQCWSGAQRAERDSAALVLLAERVAEFVDIHADTAVSAGVVHEFLIEIRAHAARLKKASDETDTAFVDALNNFAAHRASLK
jgi:DNA-binding transcriptional regulator/RsmH inhibitor MraZ